MVFRIGVRGMHILVIGAGRVGAKVIAQLKKNKRIRVSVVDPREVPRAVSDGVIEGVDYRHELNPGELLGVIREVMPDLVLVTTSREDVARMGVPGVDLLVEALRAELEVSAEVPIVAVSREV
jgi:3-hydroxyacyl-CoA dehydrogenase